MNFDETECYCTKARICNTSTEKEREIRRTATIEPVQMAAAKKYTGPRLRPFFPLRSKLLLY